MVMMGKPAKTPKAMMRFVPLLVIALLGLPGAEAAHAQDSPSDLLTRIDRLQETIRNLTGSVEQLQYRNQQLEQRVQRLEQMQSAARPPAANAAPPPTAQYSPPPASAPDTSPPYAPPPGPVIATAPAAPAAPVESDAALGRDAFNPALHPNAPGAPRPLGASTDATEPPPEANAAVPRQPGAPLDLSNLAAPQGGTAPAAALPPPPPANPSATGAMQAALPPSNSPKDEYDLAYGYVLHKDYGLAEETFRDFLHKYPGDRLVPEAQYWLGEALFQDQHYHDAAESFLAVSTKYENTARAPDALLRLGQSLAAMGEKEAACASLGEVLRKYPHASIGVKQGVDREQKRVHC
jgi:tol-pal system protein YbgF